MPGSLVERLCRAPHREFVACAFTFAFFPLPDRTARNGIDAIPRNDTDYDWVRGEVMV